MRVVTFGEIMLRLSPPDADRFVQASCFNIGFGGAEANVAVSLAGFGADAVFVTKLPEHEIGQYAVNELRRYGANVSEIVRGGERVGIYYCETGASQRSGKVVYDRKNSSIATASVDEFDWDVILDKADWFHFTGITPALSENAYQNCLKAVKVAAKKGVPVSVDLNYRKKLWTREEAGKKMGELLKYCAVVIANEEDCKDVFSIESANSDISSGKLNREGYCDVARALIDRFGCKKVAITLRESLSASDNRWSAMLYSDGAGHFSRVYPVHIVDRVGGGDSFGAGLIYGFINGYSDPDALEFAVAASCLKHSIRGDFNLVTVAEVNALLKGGGSGRVQR